MVVNLIGFIPLGLVLSVVLSFYKGQFDRSVMVLTVLICFLLSLGNRNRPGVDTVQEFEFARSGVEHGGGVAWGKYWPKNEEKGIIRER